jgi:hypothetical protein
MHKPNTRNQSIAAILCVTQLMSACQYPGSPGGGEEFVTLSTQKVQESANGAPKGPYRQGEVVGISPSTLKAITHSEPARELSIDPLKRFSAQAKDPAHRVSVDKTIAELATRSSLTGSADSTIAEFRSAEIEREIWRRAVQKRGLESRDLEVVARLMTATALANAPHLNNFERKEAFETSMKRIEGINKPIGSASAFEIQAYLKNVTETVASGLKARTNRKEAAEFVKNLTQLGIDFVGDTLEHKDLNDKAFAREHYTGLIANEGDKLRDLGGRLYDALSKNKGFAQMIDLEIKLNSGLSLNQGVGALLDQNPSMLNDILARETYQIVRDAEGKIDRVLVDVTKLAGSVEQGIQDLKTTHTQNMDALKKTVQAVPQESARAVLVGLAEREKIQGAFKLYENAKTEGLQSSIQLLKLGTSQLGGDVAKAGQLVATAAQAYIQVDTTIKTYNQTVAAIDLLKKSGEITQSAASSAVMMAGANMAFGVVGIAMSVIQIGSALSSAGQPSAEMMIMQQLSAVMEQLDQIRTIMIDRFDSIDRQLAENMRVMMLGFQLQLFKLNQIQEDITSMSLDIKKIQTQLDRSTVMIMAGLQEVIDEIRKDKVGNCLRRIFDSRGNPSLDLMNECLYDLTNLGTNTSRIGKNALDRSATVNQRAEMIEQELMEWQQLAETLNQVLPLNLDTEIPNASYWFFSSSALSKIIETRPDFGGDTCKTYGTDLDRLIESGRKFEQLAQMVRRSNVVTKLADRYKETLDLFNQRLLTVSLNAWRSLEGNQQGLALSHTSEGATPQTQVPFRSEGCETGHQCAPTIAPHWAKLAMSDALRIKSPIFKTAAQLGLGNLKYDYEHRYRNMIANHPARHCAGDLAIRLMARWMPATGGESSRITVESAGWRNRTAGPSSIDAEPTGATPVPDSAWPYGADECSFSAFKAQTYGHSHNPIIQAHWLNSTAAKGWPANEVKAVEREVAQIALQKFKTDIRPLLIQKLAEEISRDLTHANNGSLGEIAQWMNLYRALLAKTLKLAYPSELANFPTITQALNGKTFRLWDVNRLEDGFQDAARAEQTLNRLFVAGTGKGTAEAEAWASRLVSKLTKNQNASKDPLLAAGLIFEEFQRIVKGENVKSEEALRFFDPSATIRKNLELPYTRLAGELAILSEKVKALQGATHIPAISSRIEELRKTRLVSCGR